MKTIFKASSIKHSFEGYVDRKTHIQILTSADMFIIAQKQETIGDILPSKFYSYVAAGRPMLLFGTAKSEIGEFIAEEHAGYTIEVKEDIPDAVRYISNLIHHRKEWVSLSSRIRTLYEQKMSFNKSFTIFRSLLAEVTG